MPIEIDHSILQPENLIAVANLAEQFKLTIYDAAYLELAKQLNIPLATLDTDLLTAAKKNKLAYALRT